MKRTLLACGAALVLSGCGSFDVKHSCPLQDSGGCMSLTENYRQAKRVQNGMQTSKESIHQVGSEGYQGPPSGAYPHIPGWQPPSHQETFQGFTPPGERGQPVYSQPRVHRSWAAPWVDANGRLHSGEYVYFTTPGRWEYGTLRAPGAAGAAMMGPVKPGSLGFTPDFTKTPKGAQTIQNPNAQGLQPAQQQQPPAPGAAAAPRTSQVVGGVTQPYARFGEETE